MPAELTRRALAVANGETQEWDVPEAADAATVILLRDSPAGPEVFLQRRVSKMAFAAGMYVFPGGRVEESDASGPWDGPAGEPFPLRPGAAVTASFRALTTAGARETWEECGAVLARDRAQPVTVVPDEVDAPFLAWLSECGFHVDGSSFRPWSHWVTPEVEKRRFDTRFLVAALPAAQVAADRGVESDHSSWFRPGAALAAHGRGEMPMLPPTTHALTQLADFESVAAVLAAAAGRRPFPLLPRPVATDAGTVTWRLVDAYSGEPVDLP